MSIHSRLTIASNAVCPLVDQYFMFRWSFLEKGISMVMTELDRGIDMKTVGLFPTATGSSKMLICCVFSIWESTRQLLPLRRYMDK